jgi:hypothetical protein
MPIQAGTVPSITPNWRPITKIPSKGDLELRQHAEGRLIGLRVNRYSWWTHWRELADFMLPRRYKWLITPNQMGRGSPINQHMIDSTATVAAYKCAAGLLSGTANPTRQWFQLRIGTMDSTQTSPVSLWLAECERILMLIFQESNYYTSVAVALLDLVIFGTCVRVIYEDFDNVITCLNPCLGEYYLENGSNLQANAFYREFTYTVNQVVEQFGLENCSPAIQRLYAQGGTSLTRELVVAHAIEPNHDGRKFGIPDKFKWREIYWEWGGSASPQGGSSYAPSLLRKQGFYEQPFAAGRWDLVSNDAYGRSPGMDALPDTKQLQQESRRKAQAIDKQVNPPMLADIQLKNQPASLLPGGVTYISGLLASSKNQGFAPVYQVNPDIKGMLEDLNEVRDRIKKIFYNDVFAVISQYQTRSNVTAAEIDARRAEGFLALGPVFTRLQVEFFGKDIERVFGIAQRAGLIPPAPPDVQGMGINIKYRSMLEIAQDATVSTGIERIFQVAGQMGAIDPAAIDNVDIDYGIEKMSFLLNNDPKLIRSPEQLMQIRQSRAQQQAQQQRAAQAEQLAKAAQAAGQIDVGGGQNAIQAMLGQQPT